MFIKYFTSRLGIRKSFLTQRMVVHWNRLPSEVIVVPNLQEFRKCLGNALRHMLGFLGLSCARPGVGLNDPCGSLPIHDNL